MKHLFKRVGPKEGGRKVFLIWVGYQAIKGCLTTAFIWIPLLYYWWQH